MTAYFDTMFRRIQEATQWDDLVLLDQEIVQDMSLATMDPSFPDDLRKEVDRLLLCYSPEANRLLIEAPWTGSSDVADEDAYRVCLHRLQRDLHTIFHERAIRDRSSGDNPRVWLESLRAAAEERRELLAQELRGKRPEP